MEQQAARAAARRLYQKVNFTGGALQFYELSSLLNETYDYLHIRISVHIQRLNPIQVMSRLTLKCQTSIKMGKSHLKIQSKLLCNIYVDLEYCLLLPSTPATNQRSFKHPLCPQLLTKLPRSGQPAITIRNRRNRVQLIISKKKDLLSGPMLSTSHNDSTTLPQ